MQSGNIGVKTENIFPVIKKFLYSDQEIFLREIISNAVDAKDKYTRAHSQRVAEYSQAIAKRMGWSEEKIKEIHEIALLHDIGKIGVPDSILNCPGRLTNEQFDLMKTHTIIGGEILKDLTILTNVDLGAKYHHERYDGMGYPSQLQGKDIPIEARIIAVADAFDAMNSNRIYRNKLTKEKIMSELPPETIILFLEAQEDVVAQISEEALDGEELDVRYNFAILTNAVSADVEYVPSTYTKLTNEDDIKNMEKMLDMFDDNDDVQGVWHNWEMDD